MDPERIADKIIGFIADGRVTYALIETVGYWIARKTARTDAEHKLLTLANSIIINIQDVHNGNKRWKD